MSAAFPVWIISGPTAVGKGTLVERLSKYPGVYVSVSCTTRKPRLGEVDGVSYFFVSDDEFDDLIAEDGFLEWAVVHGQERYGTLRKPILDAVAADQTVILEIDLAGAEQVRSRMPEVNSVFVMPPSWDELVRRLKGRGTETAEQQARRLQTAKDELARSKEFDHIVVNDELETAVADLVELLGL